MAEICRPLGEPSGSLCEPVCLKRTVGAGTLACAAISPMVIIGHLLSYEANLEASLKVKGTEIPMAHDRWDYELAW
jgi:hypothetical protein